jgi:hypothetical protein
VVVATAILDRLLNHSHVITIRGDSYRLREKRRSGLLQKTASTLGLEGNQKPSADQICVSPTDHFTMTLGKCCSAGPHDPQTPIFNQRPIRISVIRRARCITGCSNSGYCGLSKSLQQSQATLPSHLSQNAVTATLTQPGSIDSK